VRLTAGRSRGGKEICQADPIQGSGKEEVSRKKPGPERLGAFSDNMISIIRLRRRRKAAP
jgi:hypothetical protein